MGWKDLLQTNECIVLPWVGERSFRSRLPTNVLRKGDRTWQLTGKHPPEYGWYEFKIEGRSVKWTGTDAKDPDSEVLHHRVKGFLVGDRIIPDGSRVDPDPKAINAQSERVHLIDPGLDRFTRVVAGRTAENSPLVYVGLDMPLGVEDSVIGAFLDEKDSVSNLPGIPPALDAAFRLEVWQRVEAKRRREELDRIRREEEARRAAEERRRQLVEALGDGKGRREMAVFDFEEAARAALAVGGATYLDHRNSPRKNERIVRFRYKNRRFECICDALTLRIIDSGICLVDHATGEKGDTRFTLESLPAVIQEAMDDDKLVVFRHVN